MDINAILAVSSDDNQVIIEPKQTRDWMYVLGCSAPCNLPETHIGHYKAVHSVTVDLSGHESAVIALLIKYQQVKSSTSVPVVLRIERREDKPYIDLPSRHARIFKRPVQVTEPYELVVRLPEEEPYNGEWLSTMTDDDVSSWRRDGLGYRHVDPQLACKYINEEIGPEELLTSVAGESPSDKLTRLEQESALLSELADELRPLVNEHVQKLDIEAWAAGEKLPVVLRYVIERYLQLFEDRDDLLSYLRRVVVDFDWPEDRVPEPPKVWDQASVLKLASYLKRQRDKLLDLEVQVSGQAWKIDYVRQAMLGEVNRRRPWYWIGWRPKTVHAKLNNWIRQFKPKPTGNVQ